MRKKTLAGEPTHEDVAVRLWMPQSDANHFRYPFAFRCSVSIIVALFWACSASVALIKATPTADRGSFRIHKAT